MTPNVLSIAGSDPSGGAGIQADLKTFSAFGCYGMAAITACTAQNTKGVTALEVMPAAFVREQLQAVFDDINVHAVKIGMIADADIANAVADILQEFQPPNIVIDPVMVATSGDALISSDAMDVMKARLIPLADIITPNIPEALALLNHVSLRAQRSNLSVTDSTISRLLRHDTSRNDDFWDRLLSLGAKAVLLKGGHLSHEETSNDVLAFENGIEVFEAKRISTPNTHGTGCTLSSAIAANLAKGVALNEAVGAAKQYLTHAIKAANTLDVGKGEGHGPVCHLWDFMKR